MVHVMTPKSRLYFDIEGKWKTKGAQLVDISSWLTINAPFSSSDAVQRELVPTDNYSVEDDPFWS
jgi:hypothetical protein